jgi:hypothetical protein
LVFQAWLRQTPAADLIRPARSWKKSRSDRRPVAAKLYLPAVSRPSTLPSLAASQSLQPHPRQVQTTQLRVTRHFL